MSGLWMRATTAGHDEFRDIGVPKHFCALSGAVSQADCPVSGFRPSSFITRSTPLRRTGGGAAGNLCRVN